MTIITPNITMEKEYTSHSICKKCGGYCCKKCPGDFVPSDFGNDRETVYNNIIDGLRKGVLAFLTRLIRRDSGCLDTSHEVIVIRPATKPNRKNVYGYGECIFLGKNGCELPFSRRPTVCKYLIPVEDKKCRPELPIVFVTMNWIGYGEMLHCLRSIDRKMRRISRKKRPSLNLYGTELPKSLRLQNDEKRKHISKLPNYIIYREGNK